MKKTALIFVLAIFLGFSTVAIAQEEEETGNWRNFEVSMYGGLTLPSNIDWYDTLAAENGLHFGGSGGYYFNERICLGAYFTYSQMALPELADVDVTDMNYKMYDIGIYGKYAFVGESNFEPYVRLSAGANFAKFATWVGPDRRRLREVSYDPGLSAAGYLGAMYYTSDYGAIFAELGYHMDFLQYDEGTFQDITYSIPDDVKYAEVRVGVVVFFGPE